MKTRTEYGYGFFHGGDPRKFFPDSEGTTEAEFEKHRSDCAKWNAAEARGESLEPEKNPSFFFKGSHVTVSSYGLGTYEYEVECEEGEE